MTTHLPPTDPACADEPMPGEADLAALYRQLPQSEPSPSLDAAVLRAAAAALATSDDSTITERRKGPREPGDWVRPKIAPPAIPSIEHARRRARAPRWLITLGSAASLVLVAGLAWQLRESSPPPSAAVAPEVELSSDAATAKPRADSRSLSPVASSHSAPTEQLSEKQKAMPAATAKKVQQNDELRSTRSPNAAKAIVVLPPADDLARIEAPAPSTPSVPSAPPAAFSPPPAPQPSRAMNQDVSGSAASGRVAESGDTSSSVKRAPPAAATVILQETSTDKNTVQKPGDTPAQELDKIQQLFAQDHRHEALRRLRAFHHAHPQWPLSEALQAQLRDP